MHPQSEQANLTALIMKVLGEVPARAWMLAFSIGAFDGVYSVLQWLGMSAAANYVVLGGYVIGVVAATYAICMTTVGIRLTLGGGLRFSGAFLAILIPVFGLLAVLLLGAKNNSPWIILPALSAMMCAVCLMSLLAAWPPSQAVSRHFVSPLRVVAATKGSRWQLIGATFVLGSLGKFSPKAESTDTLLKAVSVSVLAAAITAISIVVYTCLYVSAWTLAARRDAGLGPVSEPTD